MNAIAGRDGEAARRGLGVGHHDQTVLQHGSVWPAGLCRHHRGPIVGPRDGEGQLGRAGVAISVLHGVVQVVAQVARRAQRLCGRTAAVQHVGPAAAGVLCEGAVGVECRYRGTVRSTPAGERARCIGSRTVVAQYVAANAAHPVFDHTNRAVVDRRGGVVHDFNGDSGR